MKTVILLCLYLVLFVWNIWLQITPEKTNLTNFFFNLFYTSIYFYSGIMALIGSGSEERTLVNRGIKAIGIGLISWGIGGVIWAIYNLVLKVDTPYPSLADLGFFGYLLLTLTGFSQILLVYKTNLDPKTYIGAGLIVLTTFLISIIFITKPDLSLGTPFIAKFLNIAYPTGDAILLAIAFVLFKLSAGGKVQNAFLYLAIASLVQVLGDYSFGFRTTQGTYWNGDISDLLFMTSATLFGIGIIKLKRLISA